MVCQSPTSRPRGWTGDVRPWWTLLFPWLAERAIQNQIWERSGATLRELVPSHDRRLQAWVKLTIDGLVDRFELQAALAREQVRRMTTAAADGPAAGDEVDELDADIRELRQGMVEELKSNGRLTLPVAVERKSQ